ncbi:MAG: TolC family protein [Deltaproteobacteria bacterium]|nr:TolC family protein [Deltaproteobacteria bacterium]
MRKVLISLILIFTLPGTTGPASAEEKSVTLREAIELGLKGNPELKAFHNSVYAEKESIGVARSGLLPKITFEERFMRTTNPTFAFSSKLNQERFSQADFAIQDLNNPAAINDYQTSISVEQPLFVRKANMGLKMAKEEYSASLVDLTRKKEEVAFNIVRTYLTVNTAKEFVGMADKGIEDAKEHLRLATLRYDSSLGLYSDVLRASTGLTEAEQKLVSAGKNLNVAMRALGLLLGLSESVAADASPERFVLKDMDYYKNGSLARNDVKSLEKRYENARNNIDLAKSDYFPVLGIGGSYQVNDHRAPFGAEGDSWTVSAFLRWNVFDGTLRSYETSRANYKAAEAREYLEGLKKSVSFRVYSAYLGAVEAQKNLELAEKALKTAEEGARLVKLRYENSLSPVIDLLDAQLSLDNARANLTARKNDSLTAIANLSYESGTIFEDLDIKASAN